MFCQCTPDPAPHPSAPPPTPPSAAPRTPVSAASAPAPDFTPDRAAAAPEPAPTPEPAAPEPAFPPAAAAPEPAGAALASAPARAAAAATTEPGHDIGAKLEKMMRRASERKSESDGRKSESDVFTAATSGDDPLAIFDAPPPEAPARTSRNRPSVKVVDDILSVFN